MWGLAFRSPSKSPIHGLEKAPLQSTTLECTAGLVWVFCRFAFPCFAVPHDLFHVGEAHLLGLIRGRADIVTPSTSRFCMTFSNPEKSLRQTRTSDSAVCS